MARNNLSENLQGNKYYKGYSTLDTYLKWGNTKVYFGVKTSSEDWGRRVTLKESTRKQSVKQKVE
jgi:hypothetical protein